MEANKIYLVVLLILAVLGNFLIRRLIRKADNSEPKSVQMKNSSKVEVTKEKLESLLQVYGKRVHQEFITPKEYLPIHSSFIELFTNYLEISFDKLTKVYDRSLTKTPYRENSAFLQIGNTGDGSEILIRLKSEDPNVYVVDSEDGSSEMPEILAKSIEEYLMLVKQKDEDAERILREKRR